MSAVSTLFLRWWISKLSVVFFTMSLQRRLQVKTTFHKNIGWINGCDYNYCRYVLIAMRSFILVYGSMFSWVTFLNWAFLLCTQPFSLIRAAIQNLKRSGAGNPPPHWAFATLYHTWRGILSPEPEPRITHTILQYSGNDQSFMNLLRNSCMELSIAM